MNRLYIPIFTTPHISSHSQNTINCIETKTRRWEKKKVANAGHWVSCSDCPLLSWLWFYLLWVLLSGLLGMLFSIKLSIFFFVQLFHNVSFILFYFNNFLPLAPIFWFFMVNWIVIMGILLCRSILSCLCPCCICCAGLANLAVSLVKLPIKVLRWFTRQIPC